MITVILTALALVGCGKTAATEEQVEETTAGESNGFSDVQLGRVVKNGADRYVVASAMGKDYYETPYQETMLFYLDIPKTGVGVLWQIEINEIQLDELTEPILAQIGQCYGIGIDLSENYNEK